MIRSWRECNHSDAVNAKSGVKRSLLTKGHGVPMGVVVAGANWSEMTLVQETVESVVVQRPRSTVLIHWDKKVDPHLAFLHPRTCLLLKANKSTVAVVALLFQSSSAAALTHFTLGGIMVFLEPANLSSPPPVKVLAWMYSGIAKKYGLEIHAR